MKFWAVNGADIRSNWVHDNHGPGLWADTNNNDFLIENNLMSQVCKPGIAPAPLYDDCRWKTQRVDVHGNGFLVHSDHGAFGVAGREAFRRRG